MRAALEAQAWGVGPTLLRYKPACWLCARRRCGRPREISSRARARSLGLLRARTDLVQAPLQLASRVAGGPVTRHAHAGRVSVRAHERPLQRAQRRGRAGAMRARAQICAGPARKYEHRARGRTGRRAARAAHLRAEDGDVPVVPSPPAAHRYCWLARLLAGVVGRGARAVCRARPRRGFEREREGPSDGHRQTSHGTNCRPFSQS